MAKKKFKMKPRSAERAKVERPHGDLIATDTNLQEEDLSLILSIGLEERCSLCGDKEGWLVAVSIDKSGSPRAPTFCGECYRKCSILFNRLWVRIKEGRGDLDMAALPPDIAEKMSKGVLDKVYWSEMEEAS